MMKNMLLPLTNTEFDLIQSSHCQLLNSGFLIIIIIRYFLLHINFMKPELRGASKTKGLGNLKIGVKRYGCRQMDEYDRELRRVGVVKHVIR